MLKNGPRDTGVGMNGGVLSSPLMPRTEASTTVGVHIEPGRLSLAVVVGSIVESCKTVHFDRSLNLDDPAFAAILKQGVREICRRPEEARIWVALPSRDAYVLHVRTPKVGEAQMIHAVRWAVTNETAIDAAESILDFDIEQEMTDDRGKPAVAATACVASRALVSRIQQIFKAAELRLDGITAPFFAFRNLFKAGWLAEQSGAVCHVDVGLLSSQISVFADRQTVLTREVRTGMNTLADAIKAGGDASTVENSLAGLADGNASQTELVVKIEPVLTRLIRQIEQTLASETVHKFTQQVRCVYLSGDVCKYEPIVDYIQRYLGIPLEMLNPLKDHDTPQIRTVRDSAPEAVMYAPAVGLALSGHARTPNFLQTFEQKAASARAGRFSSILIGSTLACLLLLLGHSLYNDAGIRGQRRIQNELQKQIDAMPMMDGSLLAGEMNSPGAERARLEQMARRLASVASIREMSSLTPKFVKLSRLKVESLSDDGKSGKGRFQLAIGGVITSERTLQESHLTEYTLRLQKSELLSDVTVVRSSRDGAGQSSGLSFELKATLNGI